MIDVVRCVARLQDTLNPKRLLLLMRDGDRIEVILVPKHLLADEVDKGGLEGIGFYPVPHRLVELC